MAAANGTAARSMMTVWLAFAMGGQNATARKLAVPDMTTTVLTSLGVATAVLVGITASARVSEQAPGRPA
jgi:hypothetical protein